MRAPTLVAGLTALLLITAGGTASAATPTNDQNSLKQPVKCKQAERQCATADQIPVKCGDTRYAALEKTPTMQANLAKDAVYGADECSFGSNRVRVFQPSMDPSDRANPVCTGEPQDFIVPPATYGVLVQGWGGSGGDHIDPTSSRSRLGGFGGFAEFDGAARDSSAATTLAPGDILRVRVGCKGLSTGRPNGSGDTTAGGGGAATTVTWVGHVDVESYESGTPAVKNDAARVDYNLKPPASRLPSFNAVLQQVAADPTKGTQFPKGEILLLIAGGGGGAGRDSFGGDGQIGSQANGYPAGDGEPNRGSATVNHGNPNRQGAGGASPAKPGQSFASAIVDPVNDRTYVGAGGAGATPGTGGAPAGKGPIPGGAGGYGAFPGGGGGGGFGGGGAGLDANLQKNANNTGGGGGGSWSWGVDPAQSATPGGDGFVVIQWNPDKEGGRDCDLGCRSVFPSCRIVGGGANVSTGLWKAPTTAENAEVYAIGAGGGGTLTQQGSAVPGGVGGYVGGQGGDVAAALQNSSWAMIPGCPGTASKNPTFGGGGGGSTAVVQGAAGGGVNPLSSAELIAGGGGGASGWMPAGEGSAAPGGVILADGDGTKDTAGGGNGGGSSAGGGQGAPGDQGGSGGSDSSSAHDGASGWGGSGGDGGGRGLSGDYGGDGGAGPVGSGTSGRGGSGVVTSSNNSGGGGGGGGYGGGQAGLANSSGGGGGGSVSTKHILTADPLDSSNLFGDAFPQAWEALTSLLPTPFEIAVKFITAAVQDYRDLDALFAPAKDPITARNMSPLAMGYVQVTFANNTQAAATLGGARRPRDTRAPRLSDVRAVTLPRGAQVRLRLDEPARLTVRLERRARDGRFRRLGVFRRLGHPLGNSSVALPRKVGERLLAAGTYRAALTPIDTSGNRGKQRQVVIRVRKTPRS